MSLILNYLVGKQFFIPKQYYGFASAHDKKFLDAYLEQHREQCDHQKSPMSIKVGQK